MKPQRGLLTELLILGIFLGMAMAGALFYLNHALEQETRLTARRLEKAFAPLIAQAHHQKDDLMLQETVAALAQAPGVPFAAIIDGDYKIIAHSRLAQIGKPFRGTRGDGASMTFPLKEGSQTWGTLAFPLSSRSTDALFTSSVTALLGFGVFLMAGYGFRLYAHRADLKTVRAELADLNTLLNESQTMTADLQQRMDAEAIRARASLSAAMNRLTDGAILLDARQRVLMVNRAGLNALKATEETLGTGLSWQDVPFLQNYGKALEQSLEAPGHWVPLESESQEAAGALLTDVYDGVQLTWFTPRSFLRADR
jgi:PAS domain-containing protein